MQRFVFTTRIGFGLKIRGEGEFVVKRAPDGSRTTALRFWCDDRRSLVRSGRGYWRYVPTHHGVTFLTRFDYDTRFGHLGIALDCCFRPLVSWATAWSFDRLRLWLETGIPPEVSGRRLLPRARRCRRSPVRRSRPVTLTPILPAAPSPLRSAPARAAHSTRFRALARGYTSGQFEAARTLEASR